MLDSLTVQSHTGAYVVHFEDEPFAALTAAGVDGRHFIVDDRVATLYADRLAPILAHGSVLRIHADEHSKSLERFPAYVTHLVAAGARRGHCLVAVGGGVVQDITAFLAATLFRGVAWEFHPTTLLAQADSCIGSKSSINVGDTKNILGTFTPPRGIHVATRVLATLDETDLRSGIGEMLKVHVIAGPAHFQALAAVYDQLSTDAAVLAGAVRASLRLKQPLVEDDEFDRGRRLVMNYGHSFGHAIEAATAFAIPHGIAVTMGMDMANWVAVARGEMAATHYDAMHPVLRRNWAGFEGVPIPLAALFDALGKDKKNTSRRLTLILPGADAVPRRVEVDADDAFHGHCRAWMDEARP